MDSSAIGCWISSLERPQIVKIGKNIYLVSWSSCAPRVVSCRRFSIRYLLLTAQHPSLSLIVRFAVDITVAGLIRNGDESDYRLQIQKLVEWCDSNNLELNLQKNQRNDYWFSKTKTHHLPSHDWEFYSCLNCRFFYIFRNSHFGQSEAGSQRPSLRQKAQQRLFFLRRIRSFGISPPVVSQFYRAVIERVFTL